MITRRGFLGGIIAACAAPPIIRTPGLLMPVKPLVTAQSIGWEVSNWSTIPVLLWTTESVFNIQTGKPFDPKTVVFEISNESPVRIFAGDIVTLDSNGRVKRAFRDDMISGILGVAAMTQASA